MQSAPFVFAVSLGALVLAAPAPQAPAVAIPRTWDQAALESLEVPLPNPAFSPRAVPVDYYYRIPVRPIYRGHPVYAPGREPAGYLASLQQREPELLWDDAAGVRPRLDTEADWIKAGEIVFDAAIFYDGVTSVEHVRTPDWYKTVNPQLTKDGIDSIHDLCRPPKRQGRTRQQLLRLLPHAGAAGRAGRQGRTRQLRVRSRECVWRSSAAGERAA